MNETTSLLSQAAVLKKIKNRYLWAGSLLHEEIGEILKLVRQGESISEESQVILRVREKMRDQFKRSREGQADRLFEHEYQVRVQPEAWQHQWQNMETSLRWFINSKWLRRLKDLGPECWKAVDEILSFDVGGIKAYAKIDCAVETQGRFYLIDWKTSAPDAKSEASLQVAALYAHEVWGAESDQIEAVAVSLLDGKTFHATLDEDALMQTYLRIEEESALLEEARSSFGSDPFQISPASSLQVCGRCSYQRLCHPQGL